MDYTQMFRAFVEFARQRPTHSWTVFVEDSIRLLQTANFSNTGAFIHLILHEDREGLDELLEQFVMAQDFWQDRLAQFFFEVDLIHRPYIYLNTPITEKRHRFMRQQSVGVLPNGYVVDIPSEYVERLKDYLPLHQGDGSATRFEVNHRRSQAPFMPAKSLHEHYMYCQDTSQRMLTFLPVWREMIPDAAVASKQRARAR
jgi:hypothetical protein